VIGKSRYYSENIIPCPKLFHNNIKAIIVTNKITMMICRGHIFVGCRDHYGVFFSCGAPSLTRERV
jgi:hypothetical protein